VKKQQMINTMVNAGTYLAQHAGGVLSHEKEIKKLNSRFYTPFEQAISEEHAHNGWFTEKFVRKALEAIANSLSRAEVEQWMDMYPALPQKENQAKRIGVVMAGNIPLVGFHDMLSVIMSGNIFIGKPSFKDDRMLKKVADLICAIDPDFIDRIHFTDGYLKQADAIIATGSDNTSRYFDYYFRDKPHIIRRNRNGVAILSGKETEGELLKLGEDIFTYFGLGCRNVTKVYLPEDYDPGTLLKPLEEFSELLENNKYCNNLEYHRSVYLMNSIPFLDNGILLLKEDQDISSPVGVVYYEKYSQLDKVIEDLSTQRQHIQCVVTTINGINNAIPPGTTQSPALWDYADGVDTMDFLLNL
jgi:hypothetical protein